MIDGRLFLPEAWTSDSARCQAAGLPKAQRGFQRKTDLALAMIRHARHQGIGFAWVGFDGFHGSDPAFPRALDAAGEVFIGDVQGSADLSGGSAAGRPAQTAHGRPPIRLRAQTPAVRVDRWTQQQPATAWQSTTLRESTKGPLRVEILRQRVWLWEDQKPQARPWRLIVRWEIDGPTEIKYSLGNAPADTPTGVHARPALLDRTRLATGPTGRRAGRLSSARLTELAPPHGPGHDGDAVPAGRTSSGYRFRLSQTTT